MQPFNPAAALLPTHYSPVLVTLSVVVAALASASAFAVVDRAAAAPSRRMRFRWVAGGSVAMGFGVWAMHFTGMLALVMPMPVSYDLMITLASFVPAIVGSGAALWVLSSRTLGAGRIQTGGLLLAAGVGAMHYTGMEAMQAAMAMEYVPILVVLSVVVAYGLALVALYTRFALQRAVKRIHSRGLVSALSLLAGVTMGCAVAGMHYTAMAAVHFHPAFGAAQRGMPISTGWLAAAVTTVATAIVGFTLLVAYVDRRVSQASDSALDAETRLRAIFETMADAVVTFFVDGRIESMNPSAETLFGFGPGDLGQARIRDLLPELDTGRLGSKKEEHDPTQRTVETTGRRSDGSRVEVEAALTRMRIAGRDLCNVVIRDITTRKSAEMGFKRLATAVEQASEAVVVADLDGTVQYVNPAFERITGFPGERVIGSTTYNITRLMENEGLEGEVQAAIEAGGVWSGRVLGRRQDGSLLEGDGTVSPVRDATGRITNTVAVFRDVTERSILERQLQQGQKLEAIGRLAAGIAHELNTPTQYVGDNIHFLKEAFEDLEPALLALRELASPPDGTPSALGKKVQEAVEHADIDYLLEEIPRSARHSLEGVTRIAKIVRAMKEFSHPGTERKPCDLNRAIESTVTVATNEWKYVAKMELDLDDRLPFVPLLADEFNQAILNMIVNAAHAIGEAQAEHPERKGVISVSSRAGGDGWVEVRVADNGVGIPDEIQSRVFEPFFTTKEVGHGTGQGLSIAHTVVVKKHGGRLGVESTPGEGSCFVIRLPLADASSGDDVAGNGNGSDAGTFRAPLAALTPRG